MRIKYRHFAAGLQVRKKSKKASRRFQDTEIFFPPSDKGN